MPLERGPRARSAGIGKVSAAGAKYQSQLDAVTKKLADGSVEPPDTVK